MESRTRRKVGPRKRILAARSINRRDRDNREEIRSKERAVKHDKVVDCLYCCLFAPHSVAFLSKFRNELEQPHDDAAPGCDQGAVVLFAALDIGH